MSFCYPNTYDLHVTYILYAAFDANVVEVRREDVQEFLGALDDSLRKATPRYNTTAV